jgi:hypothetical protein
MSKKGVLENPNTKLLLLNLVSCKYCTRVYTCYSQLYRMHFKSTEQLVNPSVDID